MLLTMDYKTSRVKTSIGQQREAKLDRGMNMKKLLLIGAVVLIFVFGSFFLFWTYAFTSLATSNPVQGAKEIDADNSTVSFEFNRPLSDSELANLAVKSEPDFTFRIKQTGSTVEIEPVVGFRDKSDYEVELALEKLGIEKVIGSTSFSTLDNSKDAVFIRQLPKTFDGYTVTQLSEFTVFVEITSPNREATITRATKTLKAAEITKDRYRIVFEDEHNSDLDSEHIAH